MYRNNSTGQVLTDEDVDEIVSSWAGNGSIGRPRECVLEDLAAKGFKYVDEKAIDDSTDGYST